MRTVLASVLISALALGAVGHAQQRPPSSAGAPAPQPPAVTFRADINTVEVNAIVTDERGNFVRDLSKDDFEVYEDGRLQAPSVFALVDLPVERPFIPAGATQPMEPDVRSTARSFDGRLYVIVLDDLHTTVLRTQQVRDAARRFILEQFGANDLAAVVHTSGRDDAAQELTSSRARLLEAIDRFQGQKLASATSERLAIHLRDEGRASARDTGDDSGSQASSSPQRNTVDDPLDLERGFNARRTLDLVRAVADWMGDIRGRRKALLFFSEGIDYDIYDVFNNRAATSVVTSAQDAIAAAQRANVSIYAIDPRGLMTSGPDAEIASLPQDSQVAQSVLGGFGRELLLAQESLISLADETGGLAVVRTNDIGAGLGRVARETSTYYLLGYVTDSTRAPGRFRKIELRVKRPGLRVRARRGYAPADPKVLRKAIEAEAKAGTSPALRAALSNPLPIGDVPVRVFAAPFKGNGKNGSVLLSVEVDAAGLRFEEREGRFNEKLEVSIVAVDYRGKVRASDRQTVDLKLRPETHQAMSRAGGVRLLSRLTLPPSRYQIRVGAHESTGGAVGTVPYDLEVPDYSKSAFLLSGLVLAASDAGAVMTTRPDPVLKDVLPAPPIARRTFQPRGRLAFLTELYDSVPAAHTVDFRRRPALGERRRRRLPVARRAGPRGWSCSPGEPVLRGGAARRTGPGTLRAAGAGHVALGQPVRSS